MEGQQFCLRWHNFQNTLLSSLPKLLDGGYLTDVTLSAGGRHIRAHRIILSACSYYFKELFKDLSALQHPVIVLPGMEYANLCALVTFMYNGEVNIYQEQLPALLAMADTLHIRGLADIAGKTSRRDSNGVYVEPPSEETELTEAPVKKELMEAPPVAELPENPLPPPLPQEPEQPELDENYQDHEDIPCSVKTKPYYSINAKLCQKERKQCQKECPTNGPPKQLEKSILENSIDKTDENMAVVEDQSCSIDESKTSITSLDTTFRYLTTPPTARNSQTCNKTSVTCLICGKQLSNQYNLRVHMETHSNSSYSCTACSHVSRSRDALRKHVSYRHPVATPQKRPRSSEKWRDGLHQALISRTNEFRGKR